MNLTNPSLVDKEPFRQATPDVALHIDLDYSRRTGEHRRVDQSLVFASETNSSMSRKSKPLRLDLTGASHASSPPGPKEPGDWRRFLLEECQKMLAQHADTAFAPDATMESSSGSDYVHLPAWLLESYRKERNSSLVGRILGSAKRIRDEVDRIVVISSPAIRSGIQALLESCCDPYFNELSRGERGGRPRIYFAGGDLDNDAIHGLLTLLTHRRSSSQVENDWAIVAIDDGQTPLETHLNFQQFLASLTDSVASNPAQLERRVFEVKLRTGRQEDQLCQIPCRDRFHVPTDLSGPFTVLSPAGLLPASILGINIITLLEGATTMTNQCGSPISEENLVVNYVDCLLRIEQASQITARRLAVWSSALMAAGQWHDRLWTVRAEGPRSSHRCRLDRLTAPLVTAAARDALWESDRFVTDLIVDSWRNDSLPVKNRVMANDLFGGISPESIPELMSAAVAMTRQTRVQRGMLSCALHFPLVNEYSMGQFFQMMMLATKLVERCDEFLYRAGAREDLHDM